MIQHLRLRIPYMLSRLVSIHHRHLTIHKHEIKRNLLKTAHRLLPVRSNFGLNPELLQHTLRDLLIHHIVLHHQNPAAELFKFPRQWANRRRDSRRRITYNRTQNLKGSVSRTFLAVVAITVLALPGVTFSQEDGTHNLVTKDLVKDFEEKSYSPYVGRNFPTRPLWGDTHLHTAASLDAFAYGDKLDAEERTRAQSRRRLCICGRGD